VAIVAPAAIRFPNFSIPIRMSFFSTSNLQDRLLHGRGLSALVRKVGPDVVWGVKSGFLIGAAALMLGLPPSASGTRSYAAAAPQFSRMATMRINTQGAAKSPRQADFAEQEASNQAIRVANWVADSRDNRGMPFVVLDKLGARVFVFDPDAHLVGSTLVLLGSATGDESAPGIGERPLAQIRSDERTTPAGRFVSRPGHDSTGEDVIWVDYDTSVAMHRVKVVDPKERRFERIATSSIEDKRISNGCVNVPVAFYDDVIVPALGHGRGIVYVLPEVKSLQQVFAGIYDVSPKEQSTRKATDL
jgi:hypothetical protein